MNRNVGPLDAKARIAVGVGCSCLVLLDAGGYITIPVLSALGVGLIGTALIVEGAARRCLLYRLLGIDRCPVNQ